MRMRISCVLFMAAIAAGCGSPGSGAAATGPFPTLSISAPANDDIRGGLEDPDHDSIPDRDDKCPDEPEDYDGFEDNDGCPDPDRDSHHAILDSVDRCRLIGECVDGFFVDDDGCPDFILSFPDGSTMLDAPAINLLDEMAFELVHEGNVVLLLITGRSTVDEPPIAMQRAATVRDNLMARGVPASTLMIDGAVIPPGSPALVTFDTISCDPR